MATDETSRDRHGRDAPRPLRASEAEPVRSATARAVHQRDPGWTVPPLWASEVRHVRMKYVRSGALSVPEALDAVEALDVLVAVRPVAHAEVLGAADTYGLSGYDAEYVALAERLGVPLVTSDKHVLTAVGRAVAPGAFVDGPPV